MNDREYALRAATKQTRPELRRRLIAALLREEKLREALAYGRDYLHDEPCEDKTGWCPICLALDEPHGNFSDTQDSNPEGGC